MCSSSQVAPVAAHKSDASSLVLKAESEAELAGVMSHEIAHVAARHGTRQATRGQLINYASIPLGFLSFSRSFESEADMLGLEYLYKTGYDPTAFVDFFEKIESLEKKKPGTISKVFSTHPPTGDRIKAAQKNIQIILSAKPEYVVSTSEFSDVRGRLMAMHNRRKMDVERDANRPRLRRAPGSTSTGPIEDENGNEKRPKADEDERPTLKRRDN